MLRVIHIPGSKLGKVVELRELTVEQWMAIQAMPDDGTPVVIRYIAEMLYVDGKIQPWAEFVKLPMSQISGLLDKARDLIDGDKEGNA